MTSASSVSLGVGFGEQAMDCGFHSSANGTSEIFAAFLDEFTERSWPLSGTGEMRSEPSYSSEEHHGRQKAYSKAAETDTKNSTSVVTREDSLVCQAPTGGFDIMRARPRGSSTETRTDSSPVADKDESTTSASCDLEEPFRSKIPLHSSVRKLTNTTYLRRMHLSKEDAVALFPEVESSLEIVFSTKVSRREYSAPFKNGTCVFIHDVEGRRWPVVIECLRTAGQRHVRFNKGWAELCSANGLSIGKRVRLARWKRGTSLDDTLVILSIVEEM